jgi:hypothetical protein
MNIFANFVYKEKPIKLSNPTGCPSLQNSKQRAS